MEEGVKTRYAMTSIGALAALASLLLPSAPADERVDASTGAGIDRAARRARRVGPHQGTREMARRRKQRARAGLPVVEPAPIDVAACIGTDEECA
jgi:hypothetical protein